MKLTSAKADYEQKQESHVTFNSKWKWYQVKEACLDVKTYLFFAIGIANTIPAGSLSNVSGHLVAVRSRTNGVHRDSSVASLSKASDLLPSKPNYLGYHLTSFKSSPC
jgi:hypothetical protein